jgi:flavin-binding protein dodecin
MAVLKVIEVMADSKDSWQDAAEKAVKEAAKTVKNIKSVWIKDQDALVKDGKIAEYRVITKITFSVED